MPGAPARPPQVGAGSLGRGAAACSAAGFAAWHSVHSAAVNVAALQVYQVL